MSTRVHELAKALGMKSQELLEHIQKSGLDVKPSPLASLDEATVARIREMVSGHEGGGAPDELNIATGVSDAEPTGPAPGDHAVKPSTPATPPAAEKVPDSIAPKLVKTPSEPIIQPVSGATTASAATTPLAAQAPAESKPLPTTAPVTLRDAPVRQPSPEPVEAPSAPSLLSHPTAPQKPGAGHGGPLSGHTRQPGSGTGPIHRSGGPLAAHTPHRGATTTPPPGRPGAGSKQTADEKLAGPQPLRPQDYIGPAGTRLLSNRPAPTAQPPLRRPGAGPGSTSQRPTPTTPEGPRREQSSRAPLPKVAAPISTPIPPRRPEGQRPAEPGGRTQKPVVKYTREQLHEMMQAGQLGTGAPKAPPGARAPARPGSLPTPGYRSQQPTPTGPPVARRPGQVGIGAPAAPLSDFEEEERKAKAGAGRAGGAADRAGRRARRAERAGDKTVVTSPVDARSLLEGGDDDSRRSKGPRRQKGARATLIAPRKTEAEITFPITLRSLSEAIGIKANDLIRKLMSQGQLVTINTSLDEETAVMLSLEFGVELQVMGLHDVEDDFKKILDEPVEEGGQGLEPRPPVITILGHVDHGKTSLLDRIRRTNVVASETGGITQHIGAYQIEHAGKRVTFVDTPGHEAFTSMRARGANVTDIVVLVVAADDGVMPQTKEAIAHARAAEVPVVVALNKIDLPNVDSLTNINKILGELSQEGLNPAEWGGDTEVIRTSATTGAGIEDLLSTLEVIAELKDLKATPGRPARGTCLEAAISEGRGVVATVLVSDGTLRVGDMIVCGDAFGRVRALYDDLGRPIHEAPPSTPVEISGLDEVPAAGGKFAVFDDVSVARDIAETRRSRTRGAALQERPTLTLENLFVRVAEQKVKTLNLILKADVQGSLEALTKELDKLENPEVPIRILLKGVGGISESDVILADASQAIIVGFRVAPEDRAVSLAEEKKIDIRRYDIIYQVTDEVRKAVEGMLVPDIKESHLGRAVVRQTFKISRIGTVAGCVVTQGTIERSAKVRLIREGREIYKGALDALKRFKDDVREVREGYECGIKIANFDDVKLDDVIEAYRIEVVRRTL